MGVAFDAFHGPLDSRLGAVATRSSRGLFQVPRQELANEKKNAPLPTFTSLAASGP